MPQPVLHHVVGIQSVDRCARCQVVDGTVSRFLPDVHMEVVDLIAEGDRVVGRFLCGTHRGTWRGHPPTGRRFERVDEVYIFRMRDGRIVGAWGLEDTSRG